MAAMLAMISILRRRAANGRQMSILQQNPAFPAQLRRIGRSGAGAAGTPTRRKRQSA